MVNTHNLYLVCLTNSRLHRAVRHDCANMHICVGCAETAIRACKISIHNKMCTPTKNTYAPPCFASTQCAHGCDIIIVVFVWPRVCVENSPCLAAAAARVARWTTLCRLLPCTPGSTRTRTRSRLDAHLVHDDVIVDDAHVYVYGFMWWLLYIILVRHLLTSQQSPNKLANAWCLQIYDYYLAVVVF